MFIQLGIRNDFVAVASVPDATATKSIKLKVGLRLFAALCAIFSF
jgi:hypothetical protein